MTDDLHHRFCNFVGARKLPRNLGAASDRIGELLLKLKMGEPVDKKLKLAASTVEKFRNAGR